MSKNEMSCQPTYEELKQESGPHASFEINGCQPTYEELKQCEIGT